MKVIVFAVRSGNLLLKSCYGSYLVGLIGDQIILILNKFASFCLKTLASYLEQINDGVWRTTFSPLLQKLNILRPNIRTMMKVRFPSFVSTMSNTTRRSNVKYISAVPLRDAQLGSSRDTINQFDPTDFLYVYNCSDRRIKRFSEKGAEGAGRMCFLLRPWSEQISSNQSMLKHCCRIDCLGWSANVGLRHNCAKIYEGFRKSL